MVQHSINVMLSFYHQGRISLEQIAAKMSHDVAPVSVWKTVVTFVKVIMQISSCSIRTPFTVTKESLLYKCGWSPLEGFPDAG